MPFEMTEHRTTVLDTLQYFTHNEISDRDVWMDRNGFDNYTYEKLCTYGFMGMCFPKEYGGSAEDPITCTMVIEELAKCSASTAFMLGAHWLAASMILQYGSTAQKQTLLPLACQGSIFAFGLTELSAGSDAAAIQSTAIKTEEGWVLNGGKLWITNSGVAEYYIVLAKTDVTAGTRGISAFIVPHTAVGLVVGEIEQKMGMHGATTCQLTFNNIQLEHDSLLGKPGKGFNYAMASLDSGRVNIAALATGISQHAFDIAKEYALSRNTFGKPIAEHQAIQFSFADMAVKIRAGKQLVYAAAKKKLLGEPFSLDASVAKLFCTEACTEICHKALQVLGGNGYSQNYPCEQLVRDARILEICEGTSEIQRMVIGNAVLHA